MSILNAHYSHVLDTCVLRRDGIPDEDELALGLDPGNDQDADGDLDEDGFSNRREFEEGTDLRDWKDNPRVRRIRLYMRAIQSAI